MKTIIMTVLGIFLALFILIIFNYYQIMVVKNLSQKKIVIKGSPEFENQISRALVLLKEKTPEAYDMVNEYVGKIEQAKISGMVESKIPPTINLADKTTFYSLTWCAGVIAHESFHSKLYHDYLKKHPWQFWPISHEVYRNFEAERKCLKHNFEVLAQINAPLSEIYSVYKDDGTHADINGDGKITLKDYWLRDW